MSELTYLEKLLDGVKVEWQTLGKVLKRTKGTKITAGQMKALHKDNAPLKIFAGGKTVAFVDFKDIPEKDINREPSIIVKSRGIIEFEYYDKPFSHKNEMWSYHSNNDAISIKYIYYFLKINEGYFQKIGGKMQMPQIATPDTDKFEVPIPCPDNPEKSLAIQSEIVRILDKFTALTAELTAELNMRKKQYNYYRDQLLSFEDGEVEWKALGTICQIGDGNHSSKYPKANEMIEQGIPFIRGTNMVNGTICNQDMKYISKEKHNELKKGHLKAFDVLIANRGEVGKVAYVPEGYSGSNLNSQLAWLRANPEIIINRYLFFILCSSTIQNKLSGEGGALQQLTIKNIKNIQIPVPSITVQSNIVSFLDKFDSLTNSISEGLPREIELRQKQYEYYRDLLFSFPKPDTVSN
ncbi:restriction endonuclease subunit S [Escherichia coli]|uniref:restriction endonuclease subunit S n=1 Tax=Escherichia coli TaxID=562 RepID=UPI000B5BF3A0|nr:restriction endonuclease subunit S [Escherichia coli]AUZ07203.1 restriction endonuclease subunit S [Escherichia coli]EGO4337014.1 restriction endonuclease subunit S [Escherichia coli]EJE9839122.1 restriction endonuclease subunit S [Escherichia coli]ELO1902935.1 restriction endonuclease subunit S [Escherichia coli]MCA7706641.1 restriction endonuclease subunit S [Escherichia coli]